MAEVIIFRLSSVLGGRSEVMETPFIELLAHIEMLNDKERADRLSQFMNMFYANPMTDMNARKNYVNSIMPEPELVTKSEQGALVTNLDQLRLLKQMQEQEAAAKMKGG
jgi:hypothetical protein